MSQSTWVPLFPTQKTTAEAILSEVRRSGRPNVRVALVEPFISRGELQYSEMGFISVSSTDTIEDVTKNLREFVKSIGLKWNATAYRRALRYGEVIDSHGKPL